ncbi:MAG TPA: diaminobutyrate--2-oxoglutarate transaminase [Alphaproteobacteria bacterium]|jgi:diaminobutyrate-2-oxoglutarate transaminase
MKDMTETKIRDNEPDTEIFDALESEVQCYARNFPAIFDRAEGSYIYDQEGRPYLDFLAGAGSLNYGHNHPVLREKLVEYITYGGITHSLDLHTVAKERFLDAFNELVLKPRNMDCVLQFTGPTGTNAVEAALKLARNIKGRHNILAFTNGFHGVSLGALAATGNSYHRDAAGLALASATPMPYAGYMGEDADTIAYIDKMLSDGSSGVDRPAAAIVETVQGEGGLNTASFEWLRRLEKLCRKHDMLLIVDDIQAGCGRTGSFFSFDEAGLSPDMVTLSKSLSGYGLPFAVVVIRSQLDRWRPGEHNGTFRGNNHAFVTATTTLWNFWADEGFITDVRRKGDIVHGRLERIADRLGPDGTEVRGRGLMRGIRFPGDGVSQAIAREAFDRGLIIETSGSDSEVVKCLPPLTIGEPDLLKGLDILEAAAVAVLEDSSGSDRDAA